MAKPQKEDVSRKLIDHVAGPRTLGPAQALLSTTFDLNPDFFESDFLPSLLRLPAWDDRHPKTRAQLEAELGRMDAVSVLMDARRLQGRPRSLRVHFNPQMVSPFRALHAKVSLVVHEDAIRLLVGSANLTKQGYRENREVAVCLVADEQHSAEAALIRQCLTPMASLLEPWWNEHAQRVVDRANALLNDWKTSTDEGDSWFVWGGQTTPLWRHFTDLWPGSERLKRAVVVSPFWSDESGDGPLARLLGALQQGGTDTRKAEVLLVTSANARDKGHEPILPASYQEFDFRTLGISARAVAAKHVVDEEDVGRDDLLRERALHAKIVLLEGTSTSLAYVGSANFTFRGWGFHTPASANIEAGVVMRRRGKQREQLLALIPPTIGEPVLLDGARKVTFTTPEVGPPPKPWPAFIRSVELRPEVGDPERLELVVELADQELPSEWAITLDHGVPAIVTQSAESRPVRVKLQPEQVTLLIRSQAVLVTWTDCLEPVLFPINVSLGARERLPFGDPDALPGENELVAFYQGQIALEDMFPVPSDDEHKDGAGSTELESNVDTSRILSYQVRAFIEALPGILAELERSTTTEPCIRLALLGPVSPVALGREIYKAAREGRSPMAAGFQLVELLACLRKARQIPVMPRVAEAWSRALDDAETQLHRLLEELQNHNADLTTDPAFAAYSSAVLAENALMESAS